MTRKSLSRLLITMIVMLMGVSTEAAAGVVLKLGDILVAEPGTASISVVDPVTGTKTLISQGGLRSPAHLGWPRMADLIRVNPAEDPEE
jgi:hypothetical protein